MKQPTFARIMEESERLAAASGDCDAELHDLLPAEVADRLKAMIP